MQQSYGQGLELAMPRAQYYKYLLVTVLRLSSCPQHQNILQIQFNF